MRSIDDPQLRFYLERKELIDQWVSLRKLEVAAVDQFATSLEPDVSSLAADLGCLPVVGQVASTRVAGLYRPTWQIDDETPVVLITVAWSTRSAGFTAADTPPWVGVRVRRSGRFERPTHALALRMASMRGGDFAQSDGKLSNWPVYAWVPKNHDVSWDDLSPYRTVLLERLAAAWHTFSTAVDAAWSPSRMDPVAPGA